MQAAAAKLDPIATEALAILEKKLMEDVSSDAAEVSRYLGSVTLVAIFFFFCGKSVKELRTCRSERVSIWYGLKERERRSDRSGFVWTVDRLL